MAQLDQVFDIKNMPVAERGSTPLPAGWYSATIHSAEVKKTKAGTGEYIAVRYDITGPTYARRVVFGNLNIKNESKKAEEIGHQQFGAVMRALGLKVVTDTDQLIGGQLMIKLDVRLSEQYGDSNDVKDFKSAGGAAMPQVAPAASAKASPPWVKK